MNVTYRCLKCGHKFLFPQVSYGLNPLPPWSVIVSPVTYSASLLASKTHTRHISFFGSAEWQLQWLYSIKNSANVYLFVMSLIYILSF